MRILLLTNEINLSAPNGGAQRTSILIEALKQSLPSHSKLKIESLPLNYDFDIDEEVGVSIPYANDIEFAIRLERVLQTNPQSMRRLIDEVASQDYVILDNCYLGPIIRFLKKSNQKCPRLVYLSHNHEGELKKQISEILDFPSQQSAKYIGFVKELENFIWNSSDFRLACSETDVNELSGDSGLSAFVLPNGGKSRNAPTLEAEKMLGILGCESYALFVASDHPPNVHGFLKGIGIDLGFVPRKSRIVLVGSSANTIQEAIRGTKFFETFLNKSSVISNADDELLDNLYAHTSCVLLPIFQGSGTSIKAVEALLSGKKLISSPFALRGLDEKIYAELDIDLCETPEQFRMSITKTLPLENSRSVRSEMVQEMDWAHVKIKAVEVFQSVFQGKMVTDDTILRY